MVGTGSIGQHLERRPEDIYGRLVTEYHGLLDSSYYWTAVPPRSYPWPAKQRGCLHPGQAFPVVNPVSPWWPWPREHDGSQRWGAGYIRIAYLPELRLEGYQPPGLPGLGLEGHQLLPYHP